MLRRVLRVALLAALAATALAQERSPARWTKLETEGGAGKQDDIFFVDSATGWYANGLGKIFRTRDGGKSWKRVIHKKGTYFRCLGFLDATHGFAGNIGPGYFPGVTDTTWLYETKDGGETWKYLNRCPGLPPSMTIPILSPVPIANEYHDDLEEAVTHQV